MAQGVALLAEDPELGAPLPAPEFEDVRARLIVPLVVREAGEWDIERDAPEPSLGLILLDGLVTVNVILGDRVASQLAGPGDVLHGVRSPDALLPVAVAHHVSEHARAAVLDYRFIAAVRRWPALLMTLHERLRVQERRLAVFAAIGKLRRLDDRVLAVLWHLAERWGRITPAGVVVPLSLTHETIGRLAGAERPTVSLALSELARNGAVRRREDGAFVLAPNSRAALAPGKRRPPQARPLAVALTPEAASPPGVEAHRPSIVDIDLLRRRVAALSETFPERSRSVEELLASARGSAERSAQLRARVASDRRERALGRG